MGSLLYQFNDYGQLTKTFAEDVRTCERPIFQPVYIINKSREQKDFLKENLARHNGIAAHLKFHSIASLMELILEKLQDGRNSDYLNQEGIVWKIFQLLDSEDFKNQNGEEFVKVCNYCGENEQKRMGLAIKTAQLFVKYQDEAQNLLQEWRKNIQEVEDWQEYLYKTLLKESGESIADKTVNLEKLQDILRKEEKQEALKSFLPEVYLFEPEFLSSTDHDFVKLLANYISVKIYYLQVGTPGMNNPVVSTWAACALKQLEKIEKFSEVQYMKTTVPVPETLLQNVQQDFLFDHAPNNQWKAGETDQSILAYNSFTPVREVEALYNYLVDLLKKNSHIGSRDIMVVIPDLRSYVAPIRTVFETAAFKFPYSIVSRGFTPEDSFWSALEQVLSFNEDSFTASGVYGLAENKWIKQAFGFQDLDLIKEAIDAANIRRTYCGEKEDESCFSSWQFGLKRLIYGYCLGNQEDIIDPEDGEETILPVDFFEGEKAQDLFRLNRMVEMLHDLINVKSEVKSTNDWEAFCLQIAENFLCPESWQLKKLKELLEGTGTKNPDSEFQIGFAAWFFRFRDLLEAEGVSRISGNAGILFTGLYPGNALPKKVVAFLGMNFRQFPRKRIELDFDRTQTKIEEPSLKKISHSDWERYVFLKIFQSAGEQVLLSYIGQNAKNNAEIPPSGVVDQVLDYAGHYTTEDLIVKHKLHAHSTIYYQNKKHYFSYLANAEKADIPRKQKIAEEVVTETTDVFLFELEQFYKNPIKNYYNKTLGIYYEKEDSLRDTELFDLGNLDKWSLKSRLFEEESQLREGNSDLTETELAEEIDLIRKKLVVQGMVPLRNMGLRELNESIPAIVALHQALTNENASKWEQMNIVVDLEPEYRLYGEVWLTEDQRGLYVTVSKCKDKNKLEAYLKFLLLKATGKAKEMLYLALDGKEAVIKKLIDPNLSAEGAKETLKNFIVPMKKNLDGMQAFCLDFGEYSNIAPLEDKESLKNYVQAKLYSYDRFQTGMFPDDYFLQEHHRNNFFCSTQFLDNFRKQYLDVFEKVDIIFSPQN